MQDFEKLGQFYLGRRYDLQTNRATDELLLYDSTDLVTHALCLGITGSGKTGLCLALIEEAAIDGVPALIVDPKGDLGNLLMTFPDLAPEDFAPWVDEDEARRKGKSRDDFAAEHAARWKAGLASWGEDGARIARFKNAAEFTIYTPGSTAGVPISILKSFAAPTASVAGDAELLGDRIQTTATSLLALAGVDTDPIRSREHILLSTILRSAWIEGRDLGLPDIIQHIQTPPVRRVGVMDVDAFFPPSDRFALAMSLNNLLAAPGFDVWMRGDALDIGRLLHTPAGKPRVSVLDCTSERCRTDVLRFPPFQRDARLDAGSIGHRESASPLVHGRNRRVLPACGQSSVEGSGTDVAQTGASLWSRDRSGYSELG